MNRKKNDNESDETDDGSSQTGQRFERSGLIGEGVSQLGPV